VAGEKIELIFEDDDLIVINKPPGLLTMATSTERTRTAYAGSLGSDVARFPVGAQRGSRAQGGVTR
jgi:23S rRNA-/tRNA-specific pseudouridylate synthase